MTAVDEVGRLPGGLPVREARRLLLRRSWGRVLLAAGLVAVVVVSLLTQAWPLLLLAGAVVVGVLVPSRPGVRVNGRSQPDLVRLVGSVAAAIGAPAPQRIWLDGGCEVHGSVGRRGRELVLGLDLLPCLSRTELAALIAHELSTMDYSRPGLVHDLLTMHDGAIMAIVDADEDEPPARAVRRRDRLAPLAEAVHRRADAAAIMVAGSAPAAALAFARTDSVQVAHGLFPILAGLIYGKVPPRSRPITDIHDGWCRWVERGITVPTWDESSAQELCLLHPGLDGALRPLATVVIEPELAKDAVPVDVLPDRQARRLFVRGPVGSLFERSGRWRTFATAPESWWRRRAARDAAQWRRDAEGQLGRPPRDDVEVAQTLIAELVADGVDPAQPASPLPGWFDHLVEDLLLRRGWRMAHPAVRGVLVGPGERRVDAHELVRGTLGEPDLSDWRRLLLET